MKRAELERSFDEAIRQAMNREQWASPAVQSFALTALAIAVRGLWPEEKQQAAPVVDERDFGPPVNQGGG